MLLFIYLICFKFYFLYLSNNKSSKVKNIKKVNKMKSDYTFKEKIKSKKIIW